MKGMSTLRLDVWSIYVKLSMVDEGLNRDYMSWNGVPTNREMEDTRMHANVPLMERARQDKDEV